MYLQGVRSLEKQGKSGIYGGSEIFFENFFFHNFAFILLYFEQIGKPNKLCV